MPAFLWFTRFFLCFVKESLSSAIIQFSRKNCKTTEQLTLMVLRLHIVITIFSRLNHFKVSFSYYWDSLWPIFSGVTYLEWLQHLKSHEPLITWSCKIMKQTKIIVSPVLQCVWPLNFAEWWLTIRGYCLTHKFTWPFD